MKIRHGFVSNSSSSSFCIYGVQLEERSDSEEADDMYEKAQKAGLELIDWGSDWGGGWLGKSWSDIGDDETGKQFKENIEKKIEAFIGKKMECGTHSEATYNG